MWYVVLNEEMVDEPHETPELAEAAARRLVVAFEAEHGAPARYVLANIPKAH